MHKMVQFEFKAAQNGAAFSTMIWKVYIVDLVYQIQLNLNCRQFL